MANLYLEFDEEAGNKTQHIIPKCYDAKDVNANSSERQLLVNYMAKDGGIPVNFGLNILGWMIILILFCIIRRFAWDHGRIALIQEEDQGQTETSYGSRQTSEEGCASQEGGINTAKTQGCFSWIRVFMRVTEKQIRLKCGENAFHYIRFQKHILFYSVIIFGLSIGIILQVNNSGTNEPVKDSFGTTTVSNLIANSNIFWCHTVFAILYTVIMVIVLRKFSEKLEFESHNDSKKTSMMTNVPKNVTSELINQHFREIYGESQVLDVQVAFDFVKLKQAKRKVLAAQMGREHCEELLRKTRERPLTTVTTNKLSPCCHCCGSSHVDGIEYFTEEEEKGKVEVDQHRQELKSLGIAFVTFKNAENVERCLGDFNTKSESSVSRRDFLDNAKVSKAPLPGDIIWEHLSADNKNFCFRAWPINTALFIFVLFFTTPTVALSTLQELKAIIVKSNPKLAVPPNPFFTQFVPTILLWSFAAILPAVVSGSSYCEAHWKRSKLEHSVMIKTYIFLMLMLIILPSLTLTSADALFHLTLGGRLPEFQSRLACVFLPNNGAFFVNYLVTSALIGTALELCRFPELVSYGGSMVLARNEGEKRLVRKEAVRDFAYGRQYAWMLVIFTMMVVYSLTCPLVTPFGLLYLAMKHLVDRYNLYFNYRPAADNHVDNKVHYIAMTFAVFSTFFLFLSLFSYSFIRLGIQLERLG